MNVHRSETRHSNFIAWLLNPQEFHGLGSLALQKFLDVCMLALSESKQHERPGMPISVFEELTVGAASVSEVKVETEKPIGKYGRIDIYLTGIIRDSGGSSRNFNVLIENKVDSREHDSQTVKYYEWLKANSLAGDLYLLVYLTPLPTVKLVELEEAECRCKDFLQINYQYLVDYLIEPAISLTESDRSRAFMSDYIRALSVPSVERDATRDNEKKGDFIMAISEHERRLLAAFWEKHRSLLVAAFYAFSSDPNQDEDARKIADRVVTLSTKDFSPYAVMFDGKEVVRCPKKTSVGREVVRILLQAGLSEGEFTTLRNDKSSGFLLLKKDVEILDTERKPNRYRLGHEEPLNYRGEQYYVSGNWGEPNIPRFNRFLAEHFPRVELKRQSAESLAASDAGEPID
ncbi:MAG TPA: PD-(D/E)XK nuclease family protein [Blastocatellia bacterium]|nr:PD-(D/E)XK nuclease family protein [Blastocatellia bacterium]